jgi:hypothetical protein
VLRDQEENGTLAGNLTLQLSDFTHEALARSIATNPAKFDYHRNSYVGSLPKQRSTTKGAVKNIFCLELFSANEKHRIWSR